MLFSSKRVGLLERQPFLPVPPLPPLRAVQAQAIQRKDDGKPNAEIEIKSARGNATEIGIENDVIVIEEIDRETAIERVVMASIAIRSDSGGIGMEVGMRGI